LIAWATRRLPMKNDSGAKEDLLKGRKSSATCNAIARKDNDRRSARGDQHPWEPSKIGIGRRVITAGRGPYFIPFWNISGSRCLSCPTIITGGSGWWRRRQKIA
jgi:hypothetical protein